MTKGFDKTPDLRFVPIPPSEQGLQTLTAEPWFKVSDKTLQLEGLCFDRDGNLVFCDVFGGTIFRLDLASMALSEVYKAPREMPASVKVHQDGRLFVCCLGDFETGHIFAINPDGSGRETILEGYVADDMVFAPDGSFYFTHFVGKSTEPTGGVYHVSADGKQVTPILERMAGPNGVALSKNNRVLWVTETNANRLHLIELNDGGTSIAHYGTCVPYHFTGFHGPDSCSIDDEDNLYVAMYSQGRVMIFNPGGYPIGQVLIPGREKGQHLRTTHPMLIPGSDDLIICTNDGAGDQGSWLFRSKGFAQAHQSFQFS
ncbi:SMP-30/gluconolactonase/LRE family protein [Acidisoma cellulosilytica]|uniref:SMP-30/gluconolactonase/LRE family protein n=1 Tax=Acidisoma cellulosilyticum TaxID=2802395 RepID=A0A964E446_9PROT|nr:SMP-30/gluconolactonase/LRE family protein [Acidisoma cellulosilyticum]MCB8881099.1 SMP-30/gluconolactonase/LRE family protein [Acidisoma cellulosilyticum]